MVGKGLNQILDQKAVVGALGTSLAWL